MVSRFWRVPGAGRQGRRERQYAGILARLRTPPGGSGRRQKCPDYCWTGHLADGDLDRDRGIEMLQKARACADDVERRTTGADVLARGRLEIALLDPGDRLRELGFESRKLGAVEGRRHGRVGALEELIDDLDLVGAGPEAGQGIDETLKPVVALDQLFRGCVLER